MFFGGGTPSLFSPATLARLIEKTVRLFGLQTDAEITMEANPGSLEGSAQSKLKEFRSAGINRLSIGGQSFHDRHLETLGRIHDAGQTEQALRAGRAAGFDNISCDLIFAIPDQTLAEWHEDLEHLIALSPDHISAYNLTFEPGTPMTGLRDRGLLVQADEELELAMFESTIDILADAGFAQYEISNYARAGRRCRHNLSYWGWRDYLGLGAGAHGFCRLPTASQRASEASGLRRQHGRAIPGAKLPVPPQDSEPTGPPEGCVATRYANRRIPELYMASAEGDWAASVESITEAQAIAEFLLVRLRVIDGFSRS